jgi:SMC interacting uncharacterized protein involved in chromosome segregation
LSTLGAATASNTVQNNKHDHVLGNNPPDKPVVLQPDIDTIIAAAIATSNAKLSVNLKKTQEKFAILENEIAQLHQTIAENTQKVAAVTSKATIAALTGPESPFVTKADNVRNQEQHVQTQVQIGNMQHSINKLLHTLTTIMNHQSKESTPSGSIAQNPFDGAGED